MTTPIQSIGSTFMVTSAMLETHNLQALVELAYVQVGNTVMNSALNSLGNALTLTQASLNMLTTLQNLHNQITIPGSAALPFNFTSTLQYLSLTTNTTGIVPSFTVTITTATNATLANSIATLTLTTNTITATTLYTVSDSQSFMSGYEKLASIYYGAAIVPIFHVSLGETSTHPAISGTIINSSQQAFIDFKSDLESTRAQISGQIARLASTTAPGDPTSLLSELTKVYNDIPSAGASFSTFKNWVIDSYNATGGSGVAAQGRIDQDITDAITAAQSLNTSQSEGVRRYMFVFEQYIQSAAAILQQLTQIFNQVSRGISGS